jgi:cytochrome c oxidase subunit 3
MSVVLVFIVVVIGFSLWWLAQQRVATSKPWLEVGADPIGGPEDTGIPTPKIALGVFLAVVGALFALFASAYFMRMEFIDWRPMPVPRIVWLNTAVLVLASVLLQCALVAARAGDAATMRLGLASGGVATLGFLAGQLVAWRELEASGYLLTTGPADSFFYLLTAVHGLHVVGGLVALARVAPLAWAAAPDLGRLRLRLDLCATYWHFLLLIWAALLVLFTGWAADFVAICRQILT